MRWQCCITAVGPTFTTCRATRTSDTTATAALQQDVALAEEMRGVAVAVEAVAAVEVVVSALILNALIGLKV